MREELNFFLNNKIDEICHLSEFSCNFVFTTFKILKSGLGLDLRLVTFKQLRKNDFFFKGKIKQLLKGLLMSTFLELSYFVLLNSSRIALDLILNFSLFLKIKLLVKFSSRKTGVSKGSVV
ncbi:hypothetical protein BpHYR1_033289 [Brachionus plicatilis]|uniref:Uncharacterized protein n=1 Tax=Brachionus plicatilis TaxID=10195 RepID=A0A3M7R7C5_BRAPC|nr:hypothetical protein BpHYR1_033289 [Brachionus plicatilis]